MTDTGMVTPHHSKKTFREVPAYQPPSHAVARPLPELLEATGRSGLEEKQLNLLRGNSRDVTVYCSGNIGLLSRQCVSVVGTRNISSEGVARARRLAKELVEAGIVVVSGLAKGVDTVALSTALEHNGSVVAVIGTPLDRAYPAENTVLQQEIYQRHLLLSPFAIGENVYKSNFPKRNRVMAAISDATVIVEASDTSGTLHQAAECHALGRWLFILRAVVNDPTVSWPARFLKEDKTVILDRTEQITEALANL